MATSRKGIPTPQTGRRGNRAARDLAVALAPEVPCFPFPPELTKEEEPIWTDIVNTKTVDYWTRGDIPLLRMYTRSVVDVYRLTDEIKAEGEIIYNARNNPVVNPKAVLRGFAEARLMTLATKLRMQPSSRVDPKAEGRAGKRKQAAADAAHNINDGEDGEDGLLAGSRAVN